MISCKRVIVLKFLGYLALLACAVVLAIAGSFGGIGLIYGRPSGAGGGGIVIIALFAIVFSVSIAAWVAYRLMRRSAPKSRHLAFPALSIAFSFVLSPAFVALAFLSLGIH